MATKIVKCPKCMTENTGLENFCRNCGNSLPDSYQNQQVQQQPPFSGNMQQQQIPGAEKKLLAGLLGIFLGGFGIHKFVLGYQQEGVILIVAQVLSWVLVFVSCGILFFLPMVVSVIGIIEGVIYLTKSDEEFVQTYIHGKKPWF